MTKPLTPKELSELLRRGPPAKLTTAQVHEIRELFQSGASMRALASKFGVKHQTIKAALLGRGAYKST